ncbi:MAG: hypothetical protein L3J69_02065 [Desulfobacula sp.]|nr:hypothetical protein [Desulfobacula sp.]
MIDNHLNKFITKYDDWLEKDLIDYSSKVIPIKESLTEQKHIIPSRQAEEILSHADLIALANGNMPGVGLVQNAVDEAAP